MDRVAHAGHQLSDDKAREMLQTALAINPEGIDPNYFLGDLLYRKGDYDGARDALGLPPDRFAVVVTGSFVVAAMGASTPQRSVRSKPPPV